MAIFELFFALLEKPKEVMIFIAVIALLAIPYVIGVNVGIDKGAKRHYLGEIDCKRNGIFDANIECIEVGK